MSAAEDRILEVLCRGKHRQEGKAGDFTLACHLDGNHVSLQTARYEVASALLNALVRSDEDQYRNVIMIISDSDGGVLEFGHRETLPSAEGTLVTRWAKAIRKRYDKWIITGHDRRKCLCDNFEDALDQVRICIGSVPVFGDSGEIVAVKKPNMIQE